MFPKIITSLPGPKAKAIIDRDKAVMSPSYTRDYPLVIERGEGAMVYDPDGNRFLDMAAGIAVCSTGHSHPDVVKAISEQAQKFLHMSGTDFYYDVQVSLAERLAGLAPISGEKRLFYANSGTEAVEAALKLSRYHTRRRYIIAFHGAFHGRTMGSLSLTASKMIQKKGFSPLLPGIIHAPYAYCYRCAYNLNCPECGLRCVQYIEDVVFQRLVEPENVAAIFVEPIQGEGGYVVPPKQFLSGLRELCDKYEILLVADEVQCGMGRTGKLFASEHFDLKPDIICLAKGIASGMPLGAMIANADTMNWEPGSHASTFGGNPVSCAAALKTLDLLENELMRNAEVIGERLISRFKRLMDEYECVGDVRGRGLMIGIELVKNRSSRQKFPELRNRIILECFKKGVLLLGCGDNSLRIAPPLIITAEQADLAADTIEAALREATA
jgi:4-aminobutyrate aminotransferase